MADVPPPAPSAKMKTDPIGAFVASVPSVPVPGSQIVELAEVVRCAKGVIRTAHPEKIYDAVVRDWWDALVVAVETIASWSA